MTLADETRAQTMIRLIVPWLRMCSSRRSAFVNVVVSC